MCQNVIETPLINSPFTEPTRHYWFTDEGITDETSKNAAEVCTHSDRRLKKTGKQLAFDMD
jgi:type III restriction enzyme